LGVFGTADAATSKWEIDPGYPQVARACVIGQSHEAKLLTKLVPNSIAPGSQGWLAPRFSAGHWPEQSFSPEVLQDGKSAVKLTFMRLPCACHAEGEKDRSFHMRYSKRHV
jgi:hypothetical protein